MRAENLIRPIWVLALGGRNCKGPKIIICRLKGRRQEYITKSVQLDDPPAHGGILL